MPGCPHQFCLVSFILLILKVYKKREKNSTLKVVQREEKIPKGFSEACTKSYSSDLKCNHSNYILAKRNKKRPKKKPAFSVVHLEFSSMKHRHGNLASIAAEAQLGGLTWWLLRSVNVHGSFNFLKAALISQCIGIKCKTTTTKKMHLASDILNGITSSATTPKGFWCSNIICPYVCFTAAISVLIKVPFFFSFFTYYIRIMHSHQRLKLQLTNRFFARSANQPCSTRSFQLVYLSQSLVIQLILIFRRSKKLVKRFHLKCYTKKLRTKPNKKTQQDLYLKKKLFWIFSR